MNYRTFKRKILYTPGIISLMVLTPLAILFLDKHHIFENPRTMEVSWHDPEEGRFIPPSYINFVDVKLTGDEADDKAKLRLSRSLIKNFMILGDSTQGVHIQFSDESSYNSFVRVLDICQIMKVKNYVATENDFWIFNRHIKAETKHLPFCGTSMRLRHLSEPPEHEFGDNTFQKLLQFWPSWAILVVMATITMCKKNISRIQRRSSSKAQPIERS